jgi:hypothetical protein
MDDELKARFTELENKIRNLRILAVIGCVLIGLLLVYQWGRQPSIVQHYSMGVSDQKGQHSVEVVTLKSNAMQLWTPDTQELVGSLDASANHAALDLKCQQGAEARISVGQGGGTVTLSGRNVGVMTLCATDAKAPSITFGDFKDIHGVLIFGQNPDGSPNLFLSDRSGKTLWKAR